MAGELLDGHGRRGHLALLDGGHAQAGADEQVLEGFSHEHPAGHDPVHVAHASMYCFLCKLSLSVGRARREWQGGAADHVGADAAADADRRAEERAPPPLQELTLNRLRRRVPAVTALPSIRHVTLKSGFIQGMSWMMQAEAEQAVTTSC